MVTVVGKGMGGRKKEEEREKKLRWFRPELDHFSKRLSLIVFKYSLKTLRELLQKQKGIVFKISPFTHHKKFFKCTIVG